MSNWAKAAGVAVMVSALFFGGSASAQQMQVARAVEPGQVDVGELWCKTPDLLRKVVTDTSGTELSTLEQGHMCGVFSVPYNVQFAITCEKLTTDPLDEDRRYVYAVYRYSDDWKVALDTDHPLYIVMADDPD